MSDPFARAPVADWRERYADRVTTIEEAIRQVKPGRRILVGSGAAEPCALVNGLEQHGGHLRDNEIVHLLTLGCAPYVKPELQSRFRHTAFFIGPNVREAIQQGRADFLPVFLSEIPVLIRNRRVRVDVALIQVSPPDAHGYVSLGVSVDVVRAAVDSAELVLAEVNPRMPRTHGDSYLHVSRIAGLVPVDVPLLELASEPPGEEEQEIARHVASLVPDGATIQTGIGQIPDATLFALSGHRDLGVHTEMLSDGIMRLAELGVITGRRKTLLPGKLVTSFIMGSRALYEWAHENPVVEMRPSDFTNDPFVIARNDQMTAINSALAVDLTGQVASDTLLGKFYSGIGGQVDFVRGAARSRGGKAILTLRSTARKGTVSRIQPVLQEGAGVVTSRGDVRYVVTEYGVADLWGKNVRERAVALIEIAHPRFRAELLEEAKRRRYVFVDQPLPRAVYPWSEAHRERLEGGPELLIRPARMTDGEALQRLLYAFPDDSVRRAFVPEAGAPPQAELQRLVDLDYERSMALVACTPDPEELVGVSRYDVDPATGLAGIVFAVRDDWQGRGVGSALLRRMSQVARSRALAGFTATVPATNKPMLAVFYESGLPVTGNLRDGVYELELRFDAPPQRSLGPPTGAE